MVDELKLTEDVTERLTVVVRRLIEIAPRRTKCVFLNLEMRDTESDNAISPDLFAIVKPLFGNIKRETIDVDWDTADILMSLGKLVLAHASVQHVTIDIIVNEDGRYKAFKDDGPLRRLGGGDGMYRSKYLEYVKVEPWLATLDQAVG